MGEPFQLGRYALHAELAAGGMAVVYLARQAGAVGFGKTVAIKRLHPHLARDPYFVTMFLDEARLAARVQHPNVVPILDVVSEGNEIFLVLEYVRGETLSGLLRAARKANEKIPVPVVAAIIIGLLSGLHAAHEAKDEHGKPLSIVHRDVSPQNLIVGADGVPRVLDFGVAKAATRLQTTREGQLKGKIPYMPPEQLAGEVNAQSDVYSAGLVLWEALTSQRLFRGETEAQVLHLVLTMEAPPPSSLNPEVSPALDAVVLRSLVRDPAGRYPSAREMAIALEACVPVASSMKVAEWMDHLIGPTLAARDAIRAEIESNSGAGVNAPIPMSTPALPSFPRVAESASSMPGLASAGVSESTASLVVGAGAPPAARSRTAFVIGAVAVACILGGALAIAFAFGRSSAEPTHASTAAVETVTPATPITTPTPSQLVIAAPSISAPSDPTPALHVIDAGHPGWRAAGVKSIGTTKTPVSASTNDLNSLLDNR